METEIDPNLRRALRFSGSFIQRNVSLWQLGYLLLAALVEIFLLALAELRFTVCL